jgi:hypothetical protein
MKHILFEAVAKESFYDFIILTFLVAGSMFGVIYSYKLFYYVFFDFKKAKKFTYHKPLNEVFSKYYTNSSPATYIALLFLMYMSYIISGYLIFKYLINQSFSPDNILVYQNEFLNVNIKMFNKVKLLGYIN